MATGTIQQPSLELAHLSNAPAEPSTAAKDTPAKAVLHNVLGPPRHSRGWIIVTQLAGINFVTSFSTGLLTVGLPTIAADLALDQSLQVWPTSVYALTGGTCFLVAGTVADVIGPRSVNLTGCFFLAVFILASGLARTGMELIMFRAMQGIASALVVPSSISIVSAAVENGRPRNLAFGCLGLSMPLGFSLGLVLGGVFNDSSLGWRAGYYIGGALAFLLWAIGIRALPAVTPSTTEGPTMLQRLAKEIDWIGAAIASTSLATFSYVLAMLSSDTDEIKKPTNIVLLTVSLILIPAFIFWMRHQESLSKPALIPNSIWKNTAFTSICIMVLLSTAVMNCMELFCSLFFQDVQGTSALGASLRLLPNLLMGTFINLITGSIVHRVPVIWAVLISSGLCAGAPLLMALINPAWPYWYAAFFAQLLAPLSGDVLFTVGLIVVSDVFPTQTQALAGAVFNTVSQLGVSIGLTTISVISTTVTKDSGLPNKESPEALMKGYRASFWALFAWMVTACVVGGFGLRRIGKVGVKRE